MSLEKYLGISKKISKMEKTAASTANTQSVGNMQYGNNFMMEKTERKPYDAHEEMKRIKNGLPADISNCKLPQTIIESIKNNPLNEISEDPKMDAFTEKLSKTMPEGISRFSQIQEKLDEADNKKCQKNESTNCSTIDYDLIRSMIDESVNNAISRLSNNLINENASHCENSLKAIKLGSKFLFLDSDNNVFECKMVYKGKNKKRS